MSQPSSIGVAAARQTVETDERQHTLTEAALLNGFFMAKAANQEFNCDPRDMATIHELLSMAADMRSRRRDREDNYRKAQGTLQTAKTAQSGDGA
jgi:hypothetical protein